MTLLTEFINAAKEVATDLGMKEKIKIKHTETLRIGLDYDASLYRNGRGFNFHIKEPTFDTGASDTENY